MIDPIVLVSAGRSGSSVFHDLLTRHPDACWLPRGCAAHPESMDRYRAVFRMVDLPGVGSLLRRRYEPVEGYGFWDHHFPGFSEPFRDLRADDVTPRARTSLRSALGDLVTERRPRLVLKITGWPRVGFLKDVLPGSRFVHVVRDGRSVAESLLRMPWWRGWGGPEAWRMGPLSPEERDLWESHGRSFVALAGIEWCRIMAAMEEARQLVSADEWHTLRYEDLCREPEATFRDVLDFSRMSRPERFMERVRGYGLESRNPKWRENLEPPQRRVLEAVVRESLEAFGYATGNPGRPAGP